MLNVLAQDLLSFLRSRNRCLERLAAVTADFLSHPLDALVVTDGKNDILAKYEQERAIVMRTIELYDRKVNETLSRLTSSMKTSELVDEARSEVESGERLLAAVLSTDELVFTRIREAQNRIQKLIGDSRRSRETMSKFKSSWVAENGEEVDRTL